MKSKRQRKRGRGRKGQKKNKRELVLFSVSIKLVKDSVLPAEKQQDSTALKTKCYVYMLKQKTKMS